MNNNNQSHFSPLLAAFVGGVAGALAVYLFDDKRRKKVIDKIEDIIEQGEEHGTELRQNIDRSIAAGRKNLAKKIRQVENRVAQR